MHLPDWIYLTKKGAGTLEGYGPHPGTSFVLILTFITALAGLERGGLFGFSFGLLFAGTIYGTIWLIGAHGRGKSWLNFYVSRTYKTYLQAHINTQDTSDNIRYGIRVEQKGLHIWGDNPPYIDLSPSLIKKIETMVTVNGKIRVPQNSYTFTLKKQPMSAHDTMAAQALIQ